MTIPKTNSAGKAAAWSFLEWAQQPAIEYQFDQKLNYTPGRVSLWPAFDRQIPASHRSSKSSSTRSGGRLPSA